MNKYKCAMKRILERAERYSYPFNNEEQIKAKELFFKWIVDDDFVNLSKN